MAMKVKDGKIYIFVADSDAVNSNRIYGSTNTDSETSNYCPPETQDQNKEFYTLLGINEKLASKMYLYTKREYRQEHADELSKDIDLLNDQMPKREIVLNISKFKVYKDKMVKRYKNKFPNIFIDGMNSFEENCDLLINDTNNIITSGIYMGGKRPYLRFDDSIKWKQFKKVLFGEATTIVLEVLENAICIYPEAHALLLDINEIDWESKLVLNAFENDQEQVNNKEDFIRWLNEQKSPEKTAKDIYVRLLNNHNIIFNNHETSIYCVDDFDVIMNDYYDVKEDENEKERHRELSSAIRQYQLFLIYKQERDFRKWLTDDTNNDSKIVDTCVEQMKRLYDDLYSKNKYDSIFSIQKITKFEIFIEELFNNKKFLDTEKKQGSKDIRYGLTKYKEYLSMKDNQTLEKRNLQPIDLDDYSKKELGGQNRIFYGAPGCGKSWKIKELLEGNGKGKSVDPKNIFRTVFHPEYSNSDFVGQILPKVENEKVSYVFRPGPFVEALLRSYKTNEKVYLVIEEINRGNAAAIFGELFQLLDREKDIDKNGKPNPNFGASEYFITNPILINYIKDDFAKEGMLISSDFKIKLPPNFNILATMNSSDQNVFTMDTAFKRRWNFEQVDNDIKADVKHTYKKYYIPRTDITWETFMCVVNDKILENKIQNQTNEDKRMGKYFVSRDCLAKEPNDMENKDAARNFAYKVLGYIWDDVCRIGREQWFNEKKYRTLDELIDDYMISEYPLSIFINIKFKE